MAFPLQFTSRSRQQVAATVCFREPSATGISESQPWLASEA